MRMDPVSFFYLGLPELGSELITLLSLAYPVTGTGEFSLQGKQRTCMCLVLIHERKDGKRVAKCGEL
jgi:hypothetical protein